MSNLIPVIFLKYSLTLTEQDLFNYYLALPVTTNDKPAFLSPVLQLAAFHSLELPSNA